MSEEQRGLRREPRKFSPRRRRDENEPQRGARRRGTRLVREDDFDDDYDDERTLLRRSRRRASRKSMGRPALREEVADLNRGGAYVAAEAVALTLDVFSRVMRGVIDRAFDEDYNAPGDLVRGFANEADLAGYDIVDELRRVPARLERRFSEGIRSPRAERGERARYEDD